MNRYPVWKYILIVIALLLGALYTAPNYFVESPALQVTTGSSILKITNATSEQVEAALKAAGIAHDGVALDGNENSTSVRARFATTDAQFKAKLALERALNRNPAEPDYIVTVNLVKNTPHWMQVLRALPMNLGLDLRGGVHFLMQVDVAATTETKIK
ncbi:protein translocase subunit SecD, partial [Massilia sp. CCM 8693]|nr:protein translocase subunit SecD [Massilia aquatica]